MANSKTITNDRLYDAINSTRLELKGDISELRRQFDTLEAGRLTRAEGNINELRVELQKSIATSGKSEAVIGTRVTIIWGLAGGVFVVGSEVLLNWLTHK